MDAFLIKRNDTLPALEAVLSDADGPINLTGCTVQFAMRPARGCTSTTPAFKRAAVVVTPSLGKVRYSWTNSDTAASGNYIGEFEVTFDGGGVWTFPTSGYVPISVTSDVG